MTIHYLILRGVHFSPTSRAVYVFFHQFKGVISFMLMTEGMLDI